LVALAYAEGRYVKRKGFAGYTLRSAPWCSASSRFVIDQSDRKGKGMIIMRQLTHAVGAALVALVLACAIAVEGQQNTGATTDGLEPTPVLGWSSWSSLGRNPTAEKFEAQARALRDSGLQKMGYNYANLDDFYYQCPGPQGPDVDSYGRFVTDPSKFPPDGDTDGME